MQIGMVGLGRMGANLMRRLGRGGHTSVGFDPSEKARAALAADGFPTFGAIEDFVQALPAPRTVWLMIPAGQPTQDMITRLASLLSRGDTVIDGGNSNWKDARQHAALLAPKGIEFMDVGTSGGIWGLERGYCLMIGGKADVVARHEPIFRTIAPGESGVEPSPSRKAKSDPPTQGFLHAGDVGAGHFVKMIHNGIEYGIMQAYAEGFDILHNRASDALPAEERIDINVADVAEVWRRGSVITSWLLDLSAEALASDRALSDFSGFVEDSGEGRWTVEAAVAEAVPAPVLTTALYARFASREPESFANRLLSAMRKGFGGHVEPKASRNRS
jgi:6-phosphogluconate dehydrogenase